jgi:hypothetical protein
MECAITGVTTQEVWQPLQQQVRNTLLAQE